MSPNDSIDGGGGDAYAGRTPTRHERDARRPWDDSYRDGSAPWDLGRPQPAIVRLADRGAFVGTVLDAGCGTGEHALLLATLGCDILGVDVAPTAIERARRKAASRHVEASFQVADALRLERVGGPFERVLDVGLFHSFDEQERLAYAASLASVTRPGSALYLLCFSDADPGSRGPHPVSQAELRSAFATGWNVASIAAERIETRFNADGLLAWLARIERA